MIAVHQVQSVLAPGVAGRKHFEHPAGATVRELVELYRDVRWAPEAPLAAVLNGRKLSPDELDQSPRDHSDLVVLPDPGGLEAIGGFLLFNVLIPALIGTAINLAYNALVSPPKVGPAAGERGDQESPTYTWNGIRTSSGPGARIPIVYGTHRVGGQVIANDLFEFNGQDVLGLLIVLGEGVLTKIAGLDMGAGREFNDLGGFLRLGPRRPETPTGIKIDGTDLEVEDANISLRAGTSYQSVLRRWVRSSTTFPVDLLLTSDRNVPGTRFVTYQTNGSTVSRVRVRITFAALFKQEAGKIGPHTVEFRSSSRKTGTTAWSNEFAHRVTRAQRNRFNWSFEVDLPDEAAWDIRVRRVTPDDDETSSSASTWTNAVEYFFPAFEGGVAYRHLALLSIHLRATERLQGSVTNVTLPVDGPGLRWWTTAGGWQPPSFFDAASGEYKGRDPAWALADFLTNTRYGLGAYLTDANLDLPAFELWSAWNQDLVDDGDGGTHPRNYFDGVFDDGSAAWEIILQICRTGQAVPVLVGDKITIKFEHPDDAAGGFPRPRTQAFTRSNIRDVVVTYTDQRDRPNILDGRYLDEDLDYEQSVASVEDPDAFGLNEPWRQSAEYVRRLVVDLRGITRAAHARRVLWGIHGANRLQYIALSFTCQVDGLMAEVGDRIGVEVDVARFFATETKGMRSTRSGSATTDVYADEDLTVSAGDQLAVVIDDGSVVVRDITTPGAYTADTAIPISGAAITYPQGTVVGYGAQDAVLKDFIVVDIELADDLTRRVHCVNWDEDAFTLPSSLSLASDAGEASEAAGAAETAPSVTAIDVDLDPIDGAVLIGWAKPEDTEAPVSRLYLRPAGEALDLGAGPDTLDDRWWLAYEGQVPEARLTGLEPLDQLEAVVVTVDHEGNGRGPNDATPVTITVPEFPGIDPGRFYGFRKIAQRPEGIEFFWWPMRDASVEYYEIRRGRWLGAPVIARVTGDRFLWRDAPYDAVAQDYQIRARHKSGTYTGCEKFTAATVDVPACKALAATLVC